MELETIYKFQIMQILDLVLVLFVLKLLYIIVKQVAMELLLDYGTLVLTEDLGCSKLNLTIEDLEDFIAPMDLHPLQ